MGVIDPENEGFYLLNVDIYFSFGQYMCPQLIPLTKKNYIVYLLTKETMNPI